MVARFLSDHPRHWWLRQQGYLPPALSLLTADERKVLVAWFEATERDQWIGECNLPAIGVLQGLIEGGGIRRVVELGHYAGYSTLLLGWMLRRMGAAHGLISFDVDPRTTAYAQPWIERAGLGAYVRLVAADSREPASVARAIEYLDGSPGLVWIDSSHQRAQTTAELRAWYAALAPGGLIVLHDTSAHARQWDATKAGGVRGGLEDWLCQAPNGAQAINVNRDGGAAVYADVAGLGIVHKPIES